jgi:hypothetical protein
MNREQAKQVLANMKMVEAFANGETVQLYTGGEWVDIADFSTFTARPEFYRIKPKKLELWAIVNANGAVVGTWNTSRTEENVKGWDEAHPAVAPHRIVHLTEVSK